MVRIEKKNTCLSFVFLMIMLFTVLTYDIPAAHAEHAAENTMTASFTGTNTVTEWDVNADGLTITIALPKGYRFSDNITDYKNAIIDGLTLNGLLFDKKTNQYNVVPYEMFVASALDIYGNSGYFPYIDISNSVTVYDRFVGLDPAGARSTSAVSDALKAAYPGVNKGILNALKAGATVSVNEDGNLVIRCTKEAANGYFSTFTNSVSVVNGGIQIANCDILLSAELPVGAVKNVNEVVKVNGFFTIQEVKVHTEIWEYVDKSRAGEDGVFSFNSRINSYDRNTTSQYPYDTTYYVKQVEGNVLTAEDIRKGGALGPNGTGSKLVKVVVDTRVGPTQWASSKNMSTFFTNFFRTNKDATGYGGKSDTTYTPADDPEWLKVEDQITNGGTDIASPYNVCTNKYVVNYSGDSRMDTVNPAKMWIFFELPQTPDFHITSDMPIYVNLIAGFIGGSGQSTTTNGQPILGMDGRYLFTIKADNSSAITFDDLANYGWAKKQIEALVSKGIISGTGATTYSPGTNITRADFIMLLVKTLDLKADIKENFEDVKQGAYYYEAVGIAKQSGIATGSGDNRFNPKAEISRQDMMVLTERALRAAGKIKGSASPEILETFKDKAQVSGYAANSVSVMIGEGLVTGANGLINPLGSTTRAEAAVILYRIYTQ
ncbi:S-layer homology domain-containing protein [Paenibacillus sabinae]|uniref:SLH domain-containing protein n=1 Tax=Paenibacillus sabinae T27 TaxID=1268072 RepID=X5A3F0_9BACL|nr:S-layer homology domain-containing protein [Paenibacillus sabinae]AHV98818.1 hypothetical protein PSAB_19625 [Paenibacillus sabinae T27]